ncbi:16S rRNA (guanine(966)-N(2))-methyltransferase RsmD [Oceanicaulis sp.]|uniref:16S rRNA (guanine(966)-N(2))-methyltransferase RsmD n=1 Tax=Oceanicaulis sp. TaxID=1924941 RepID=UPI003BAC9113
MRIVAGVHKGRAITAPKGDTTRPTTDRVRESVFNKLTHAPWGIELEGVRVMDLFAGSGALGLEAISRGASFALFVETDPAARGAIRTNVDALQLFGCTKLHRRSATDLGPKPEKVGTPFDLVFLDPPYDKGLGDIALAKLIDGAWVKEDALAVLEERKGVEVDAPGWELLDTLEAGDTMVRFFRRAES